MLNLVYCELLKIRRSKILVLSVLGVFSIPGMMFIEALQMHFQRPEEIFTLSDIYDSSLLYIMILTNMMIYTAITAYLFSREYSENTLKTILPLPVPRMKFVIGKFYALLLWIMLLTVVTWAGVLALSGLYHAVIGMEGFRLAVAIEWLGKFMLGNILVYLTISPFAFVAEKSKGFVAPVIVATVIVMGSAALTNQDIGALYPWTATYFLVSGKLASTGYPPLLSISIIIVVAATGFLSTIYYFQKEDLK